MTPPLPPSLHYLCYHQPTITPASLILSWTDLGRRGCPHPCILHGDIPQLHPVGMGFQETRLGATLDILPLSSQHGASRLCRPAYKSTLFLTMFPTYFHPAFTHIFDLLHLYNIFLQPHTLPVYLWTTTCCPFMYSLPLLL